MRLVYKKTIVEKIQEAIRTARSNGLEVDHIEINGAEQMELIRMGLMPHYPNWPHTTEIEGIRLEVKE